jgi:hypothetical protein
MQYSTNLKVHNNSGSWDEPCELASASTVVAFAVAAVVACFFYLSSHRHPASVFAVVICFRSALSPFFLVKPLRQELIRNSGRKPNKNKGLVSENNLPQIGILVSPNRL